MKGTRIDRIVRLEQASALGKVDERRIREDAQTVRDRLFEIAAKLPEADATKTLAERLQMSCASHVAWALRFAPGMDLRAILAMHQVG